MSQASIIYPMCVLYANLHVSEKCGVLSEILLRSKYWLCDVVGGTVRQFRECAFRDTPGRTLCVLRNIMSFSR